MLAQGMADQELVKGLIVVPRGGQAESSQGRVRQKARTSAALRLRRLHNEAQMSRSVSTHGGAPSARLRVTSAR